jgi:16S rRNA (guanine527-N7)-methyltransferase
VSENASAQIDLSADRAKALALTPVSRETEARLDKFVALLLERQQAMNLIGGSTIPQIWTRHVADSLQLLPLFPDAKVWVDVGSGGGFPGIAIACALADKPGSCVHLVESVGKKAKFLDDLVHALGLTAVVHHERFEKFGESFVQPVHVITARAVASLKTLCDQSHALISRGAAAAFHKGLDVEAELTEAAKYWTIESEKVPSKTDSRGTIVIVRRLSRRKPGR